MVNHLGLKLTGFRIGTIAFFGVTVIFAVIFFLYDLPMEAIAYPFILSCIYLGVIAFFVYVKRRKKHQYISHLSKEPVTVIADKLPKPFSQAEEDYVLLVSHIINDYLETIKKNETKAHDMDDYYATWVHQIKTPIASMRLNLQAMDSDEARSLLRNLKSIEAYVDMVMSYLRLNSEHTDYIIREENIKDIVKNCGKKCSLDFIGKKLSFKLDMEDETVLTDRKWITLVIDQILSNSIKYTDKGGVTVSFDKESHTLKLSDTGIGIDKTNLPRIFEKGYTGFNGRGEAYSSGIGLYICKSVCENLHIDIRCESKVGEGTSFYLTFPVTKFFGD